MAEIKFEQALNKLEAIVTDLEKGNLSLEQSLAKYEEGIKLAKICQGKLENAKKKVEILVKSKDGKVRLEPFEKDTQQKQDGEGQHKRKGKKKEAQGDLF